MGCFGSDASQASDEANEAHRKELEEKANAKGGEKLQVINLLRRINSSSSVFLLFET